MLGRTVTINGHDMAIVGVAQAGFTGVELESPPQMFVPVTLKAQITPNWDGLTERRWRCVNAFARLKFLMRQAPGLVCRTLQTSACEAPAPTEITAMLRQLLPLVGRRHAS